MRGEEGKGVGNQIKENKRASWGFISFDKNASGCRVPASSGTDLSTSLTLVLVSISRSLLLAVHILFIIALDADLLYYSIAIHDCFYYICATKNNLHSLLTGSRDSRLICI